MNQRELFLRYVAQTSDEPMLGIDINIEKAEGSLLTDVTGKTYIDFISGISVSSIGHCHPRVVNAIREQSEKFMHLMVYGEFNQKPQVEYAELLCSQLPASLNSVFFTTGGSEAVEGAVKLAKRATGRSEIISFTKAYHGSTQGALSLMGDEFYKNSFRPLIPGGRILNFNSIPELEQIGENTAAVILEPIQGEAGVRRANPEFIRVLAQKCREQGALLVFDEIQSGFGRTGSLFAFEQYQIVPDLLLIAKGMGGGMPLGAFVASKELMKELTHDPVLGHINTFGGNAVCVAAAKACLEVILEEKLWENAIEIEKVMATAFSNLKTAKLRQCGAMGALEFENETRNKDVIRACLQKGLITDWFLFCPNALRLAPPLNISGTDLKNALSIIHSVI